VTVVSSDFLRPRFVRDGRVFAGILATGVLASVLGPDPAIGPIGIEAYGILNLGLGIIRGGIDVSAYVNNATRADPRLAYFHATLGSPLYGATAIRPLTTGLTAFYRF
jgi:hypothetical protein